MGGRKKVLTMFTEHCEVKRAEVSQPKPPCSFRRKRVSHLIQLIKHSRSVSYPTRKCSSSSQALDIVRPGAGMSSYRKWGWLGPPSLSRSLYQPVRVSFPAILEVSSKTSRNAKIVLLLRLMGGGGGGESYVSASF